MRMPSARAPVAIAQQNTIKQAATVFIANLESPLWGRYVGPSLAQRQAARHARLTKSRRASRRPANRLPDKAGPDYGFVGSLYLNGSVTLG